MANPEKSGDAKPRVLGPPQKGGTDRRVAEEGFPTGKTYGLVFGKEAGLFVCLLDAFESLAPPHLIARTIDQVVLLINAP
jgi:hypothetical protein